MAGIISVDNETMNQVMRTSKAGKQLEYKLRVLQQPQRARACGAGAKSSADRRPVDPPPVVELTVFENGVDITLGYNANFFLFATLEAARTQAQPRGQPITSPVLTGVPVAGVAYLDRPKQAGYFIFPDLSVRHEGNYRLSFNLFEETKDPEDADIDPSRSPRPSNAPNQHMNFRLAVMSLPFQVYSAKKFPGLSESTQLSRVVAEQGCRVRIRRDVRMRRRENQGKDDFFAEEEEEHPAPYERGRIPTPDGYVPAPITDRTRSASRGSIDPVHAFGMASRRTSMTDMSQYHQQGYQTPHVQTPISTPMTAFPTNAPRTSHLSFGSSEFAHMPMPPMAQPVMAQPPGPHTPYSHQPSPHVRQMSNPHSFHPSPQTPITHLPPRTQTPTVVPKQEFPKQEFNSDYSQLPPINRIHEPDHHSTSYTTQPSSLPNSSPIALAPMLYSNPDMQPHLNIHSSNGYHGATLPPYGNGSRETSGPSKRVYGEVFSPAITNRRLQNFERPPSSHPPNPYGENGHADAHYEEDDNAMHYKRANGTMCSKALPPPELLQQ